MQKDDLVYAGHMLDLARKALSLVQRKSRGDYDQDETLSPALTHLFQIIGEAARKISFQFRERHSDIPWAAIVGLRHRVVHDYLNIDLDLVWDVVHQDLEPLVAKLEQIVPE